ncbi:MAG: YfiR family protein, partial [Candidatus Heimdallarchaeaceae archaeon]
YIGRFAQFVDIPQDSSSILVIGVFEEAGITPKLEELYKTMKIKGRNVVIRYYSKINSSILKSHILFIPKLKNKDLFLILNIIKNSPVLTISDTQGYAEKGVHINLYRSGNNIRFEINQTAVRNSNLHISYQLYELARIVHPVRGGR